MNVQHIFASPRKQRESDYNGFRYGNIAKIYRRRVAITDIREITWIDRMTVQMRSVVRGPPIAPAQCVRSQIDGHLTTDNRLLMWLTLCDARYWANARNGQFILLYKERRRRQQWNTNNGLRRLIANTEIVITRSKRFFQTAAEVTRATAIGCYHQYNVHISKYPSTVDEHFTQQHVHRNTHTHGDGHVSYTQRQLTAACQPTASVESPITVALNVAEHLLHTVTTGHVYGVYVKTDHTGT